MAVDYVKTGQPAQITRDLKPPKPLLHDLKAMILDGFQRSKVPFLVSLLQLWRAWSIKYLKEKARITIGGGAIDSRLVRNPKSRFLPYHPAIFRVRAPLFGCVDETATLRGHFYDTPKRPPIASISSGALLFGCVDETATLLDHFPISTLPPQVQFGGLAEPKYYGTTFNPAQAS